MRQATTRTLMSKGRRWTAIVLGAVAATVVLGAAGASAGLTSFNADDSRVELTATEREQHAQAFTDCMRSNGVPNFPGITIADGGQIRLVPSEEGVNPLADEYRTAAEACADLLPDGSTLPQDPVVDAPEDLTPPFSCEGTCPSAPAAPAPPE